MTYHVSIADWQNYSDIVLINSLKNHDSMSIGVLFQADGETWARTPGFAVELVVGGDGFTGFSPSFAQLEDVCLQALEQCVTAAGSIPRVGGTSTKGKLASTCCVISACFCQTLSDCCY